MQLYKQYVLFVILAFLLFNSISVRSIAPNELSLSLQMEPRYGTSQLITGTLTITAGEIKSDSLVKVYINNNKRAELAVQDLLDKSLIPYTATQPVYHTSSGTVSSTASKLIGFKIPKNIIRASIKFSGSAQNLSLDIGNDRQLDWQYFNPSDYVFSSQIYPEEASSSTNVPNDRALINPEFERCEDIELDFNPLLNSSVVQVIVQAEKTSPGSNLKAKIEDFGNCDLPEPDPLNKLQAVGCEIKLAVPESRTYSICVYADGGSSNNDYYQVPVTTLSNSLPYYFITARKAIFTTSFNQTAIFSGQKFTDAVNNYFNTCQLDSVGYCLVPLRIISPDQLSASGLQLVDGQGIVYGSLYDLGYTSGVISLYDTVKLPIESFDITAPSSTRSQNKLDVNLLGKTASASFDTLPAPTAKIAVSKSSPALLEQVTFDGSKSVATGSSNIAVYDWDFGDETTLTTRDAFAVHSFTTTGKQTIKLAVTDASGVKSSPASISIDVLNAEQSVDTILSNTQQIINKTDSYLATASQSIKDVAATLKLYSSLDSTSTTLTGIDIKVSNIKSSDLSSDQREEEFKLIIAQIQEIQDKLPAIIQVKGSLISTQNIDYSQIIDPRTIEPGVNDIEKAKLSIYNLLNQHTIQMDAKLVRVRYVSGREDNFVLVKKSIASKKQSSYLIEYSPVGFSSLITQGTQLTPQIARYPASTSEIVYTTSGNLLDAKNAVTLPVPDLANLPATQLPECGDSICSYIDELSIDEANPNDENYYCPQDCSRARNINWFSVFFIILIAAGGVYYINFYKGPWNFKDTTNLLSVTLFKRRLFTSKKDLLNLANFVKSSLSKGFTRQQLTSVLFKKGWTEEQIRQAFKSAGK